MLLKKVGHSVLNGLNIKIVKLNGYQYFNILTCNQDQAFQYSSHASSEEAVTDPNELIKIEEKELIKNQCNKSSLSHDHYRLIHNLPPMFNDDEKTIMPIKKYRKLFGTYGKASNINLAALWPSKKEMLLAKEKEALEFPHSVLEMVEIEKNKQKEIRLEHLKIQRDIVEKKKDLHKFINQVKNKMAKNEMDAKLSLEKREKEIAEVRQKFGYYISPHDERFKEALMERDEEEKKALKKEKKLKKQAENLERLKEKAMEESEQVINVPEGEEIYGKNIIKGHSIPNNKKS